MKTARKSHRFALALFCWRQQACLMKKNAPLIGDLRINFRSLFPQVELVEGSIVTEENGIYSSGGANSYWNLLLHLVEKYTDRATAILAAKYFAIDIDRSSQGAFALVQRTKKSR